MSEKNHSFTELAQQIRVKDTLTISLNSQVRFMNHNFHLIKQCLLKVEELEGKVNATNGLNKQLTDRLHVLEKDNQSEALEKRLRELENNVGGDFMKRLYDMEEKAKGSNDIEDLAKQLQKMNRFISIKYFDEFQRDNDQKMNSISKIKDEFGRYVDNATFKSHCSDVDKEIQHAKDSLSRTQASQGSVDDKINQIEKKVDKASSDVQANSQMMKQINFAEMMDKLKKFKDDTDHKVTEMQIKIKKKVSSAELTQLEKDMIEKLGKFLFGNQKNKADLSETKDALSFLEKRINEIVEVIAEKGTEEEKDALFATRKWQCASCTKDLGKYEGKLGQFKPWSIFPCKELDPEKVGGYGYLNYVDKMAYKKGTTVDDNSLDRLNQTFFQKNREKQFSPTRNNATRATNFMSNYGTEEKNSSSLKEEYFKDPKSKLGGAKTFRMKRDISKGASVAVDSGQKERAKDIQ